MGFLKKIFNSERFAGFSYVVDQDALKTYLEQTCRLTLEENLTYATELYLYINGEKHHLEVWLQEEPKQGFEFHWDKETYFSLDDLYFQKLRFLPPHFKINYPLGSDAWLNEYKAAHPELRVEDYK